MKKEQRESEFPARNHPSLRGREHGEIWLSVFGFLMLIFAIGFNLWLYRHEPTARIDPNDNTFQYALVDRTNQIWDYAQQKFSPMLLFDHWVPNWAEGYNLPYYYSHIPQIVIVATHRLFPFLTLFTHYHLIIYLLLCFFPLSMFLALRIIGLSWITAGAGALIASHLSTDGLYGLDPASFLWRGYGLSSQLFAMIWLPLALAYSYRGRTLPAIFFLTATTAGHLGIGIIAFMSAAVLGWRHPKKLFFIFGGVLLLLAYWIVPILLHGDYHNISFWDPVWKFDSYGVKETIIRFLNGDLFDFGRLPILTALIVIGLFRLHPFSLLFAFWFLMYFGRTTWGPLIDLIPGMGEFHLSRFIVGLHIAGLFLIPMGIEWINSRFKYAFIIFLLILIPVYQQTIRYSQHNDTLIKQANENYSQQIPDASVLLSTLQELQNTKPGRAFAGRGGTWGRDFRVAETPYYMYLSTYGIPTVLWLPQTWSPNSDIEQYFSEDQAKDYTLYNIRYVVAPPSQTTQPFWKLIKESRSWKLYEVDTDGYITTGVRPAIISTTKERYINLVRLWIQSDFHKQRLYPELTFDTNYPKTTGLPNFKMLDEVTYKVPHGSTHNLFAEPPLYLSPLSDLSTLSNLKITSQRNDSDMVFRATVEVPEGCTECLVILRQTFHPSWRATVDGKPTQTMTVFPFYTAVKIETSGTHEVVFSYKPSGIKIFLLVTALTVCMIFAIIHTYDHYKHLSSRQTQKRG